MVRLLLVSLLAVLGFAAYQESEISSLRAQLSGLEASHRLSESASFSSKSPELNTDSLSSPFPKNSTASQENTPASGVAQRTRHSESEGKEPLLKEQKLANTDAASKDASEKSTTADSAEEPSPFISSILSLAQRAAQLDRSLRKSPEKEIPEMELLSEADWLKVAKEFPSVETNQDSDAALGKLRKVARERFSSEIIGTVQKMAPDLRQRFSGISSAAELNQFLGSPMNEAILNRYEVVHAAALGPEWRTTDPSGESMLPQLVIRERAAGGGSVPESKLQMGFYMKNGVVQKIITSDITGN